MLSPHQNYKFMSNKLFTLIGDSGNGGGVDDGND